MKIFTWHLGANLVYFIKFVPKYHTYVYIRHLKLGNSFAAKSKGCLYKERGSFKETIT